MGMNVVAALAFPDAAADVVDDRDASQRLTVQTPTAVFDHPPNGAVLPEPRPDVFDDRPEQIASSARRPNPYQDCTALL